MGISSLMTFPGGVSVALLRKRLEPKRELGDKAARDGSRRSDLVHAANEHEQVTGIACWNLVWLFSRAVLFFITGYRNRRFRVPHPIAR